MSQSGLKVWNVIVLTTNPNDHGLSYSRQSQGDLLESIYERKQCSRETV